MEYQYEKVPSVAVQIKKNRANLLSNNGGQPQRRPGFLSPGIRSLLGEAKNNPRKPWISNENILTFYKESGTLLSVHEYRITTRAGRHCNGNPHKSCICLSQSNGRAKI